MYIHVITIRKTRPECKKNKRKQRTKKLVGVIVKVKKDTAYVFTYIKIAYLTSQCP